MSDKDLYLGKYEHGRPSTYNRGCRCSDCRAINASRRQVSKARAQERVARGEVQFKHGISGYNYWGCRCETCTKAHWACCKPIVKRWVARNPDRVRELSKRHAPNALARLRDVQSATIEKATRHYYRWTGPELELAARSDLSAREVALLIGRSFAAVRNMRRKLRDDPKTINRAGIAKRAGEQR